MKLRYVLLIFCLFAGIDSFAQKKKKKEKTIIFSAPIPKNDGEVMMEEPPPPSEVIVERAVISRAVDLEDYKQKQLRRQQESRKLRYASYPGGEETFNELALARVELPESAKEFEGYLTVSFLVSKDGELSDFKTNGIFNKDCDTEAERVIRSLGNWDPAIDTESQPFDSRVAVEIPFGVEPAPEITNERQNQAFLAPPPPPAEGTGSEIPAPMLVETPVMESKILKIQVSDDVFEKNPDKKATFIDDDSELLRFLQKEMIFSVAASNANINEMVEIKAMAEKDGNIRILEIVKDPGFGCGENAIKAVESLPGFIPAMKNGKFVDSIIQISVPCKKFE